MQFATQIPIVTSQSPIDYKSKILSLGSCFVENMGEKLTYFKFQNTTNPFGIIFNAVSIEKLIYRSVNKIEFTETDIFFHNESWHCFEVHSELSLASKSEFLLALNQLLKVTHQKIIEATHVIITYGTSWVYREKQSDKVVANCHKVPQKQFDKVLLSVAENQDAIQNTIALLKSVNPKVNFIFTISPVRHIKDGFIENQQSKAHLIAALHQSFDFQLSTFNYFSSYEIMMDELRDYRFYAEDMLHPNVTAIRYIWGRFKENYVSEDIFLVMDEIDTIQKSLLHKPFNPNSMSHLKFVAKLQEKMTNLVERFPHIQF